MAVSKRKAGRVNMRNAAKLKALPGPPVTVRKVTEPWEMNDTRAAFGLSLRSVTKRILVVG